MQNNAQFTLISATTVKGEEKCAYHAQFHVRRRALHTHTLDTGAMTKGSPVLDSGKDMADLFQLKYFGQTSPKPLWPTGISLRACLHLLQNMA